ncbi:phage virion morphogenesis protein [Methylopila sp. 73B]|uniref:phage virion morphogenesis protein n=1 Tax=Methylopila sp. 73B TaxID=1120792 RepID=UPI000367DED3|nr:phage virion morphogenesis protein [Methylopila sp. 73B]
MAGVSISVDLTGLGRAEQIVAALAGFDGEPLMSAIGAVGESQTRRRISDEKTSPDGTPWAPNRRGGSILVDTGQHLLQSVAWTASSDEAVWGASWEHAHVHQEGATIIPRNAEVLVFESDGSTFFAKKVTIPARPFVGISDDNRAEIEELVTDFLGGLFR